MYRISAALLLRGHFIGRENIETRAVVQGVVRLHSAGNGTGCCTPCLPTNEMEYRSRTCVNSQLLTLTTMKHRLRVRVLGTVLMCATIAYAASALMGTAAAFAQRAGFR